MRDVASAAAMSDPTLNRWFKRRWVELPAVGSPSPAAAAPSDADDLVDTGLALLHEWRRLRDTSQVSR